MRLALGTASTLITCEHASNRLPPSYKRLGLPAQRLDEHIAWDRGAAIMARIVAKQLGAPCHLGQWSRLLVDLNRSLGHPKLMARSTFGVRVPGNAKIDAHERGNRLERYYYPYRDAAMDDILRIVEETGGCIHLSIHSFTPVVRGQVRRAEIGILFDPRRARERAFASALRPLLEAHGLVVLYNSPYRGTSDGFTTRLRHRIPAPRYLALEIETNQRLLRTEAEAKRMGRILAGALAGAFSRPMRRARSTRCRAR